MCVYRRVHLSCRGLSILELSAIWMLPFSMLAAAAKVRNMPVRGRCKMTRIDLCGYGCLPVLKGATLIQPLHLLAVGLICAGGLLPATGGLVRASLSSHLASKSDFALSALCIFGCMHAYNRASTSVLALARLVKVVVCLCSHRLTSFALAVDSFGRQRQ